MRTCILILLTVAWLAGEDAAPPVLDPGLIAEVFTFPEAEGDDGQAGTVDFAPADESRRPDHRRIDLQVDHESGAGAPARSRYAVRWTGVLRVPADGAYTLLVVAEERARLAIAGKPVAERTRGSDALVASGMVTLTAGDHPLRLDFCSGDEDGDGRIQLAWRRGDALPELVPAAALLHARTPGVPPQPVAGADAPLVTDRQRAERALDLAETLLEGLIEERRQRIGVSAELAARRQALDDARKAAEAAEKAFEQDVEAAAKRDPALKDLEAAAAALEQRREAAGDGAAQEFRVEFRRDR